VRRDDGRSRGRRSAAPRSTDGRELAARADGRRLRGAAAALALLSLGLGGCYFNLDLPIGRAEPLVERVVHGERGPKLAMIEIDGLISEREASAALGFTSPSLVSRTREALDRAAADDDVRGLILRVQSPGGTVTASESLHHELMRWKSEERKPVVAYLQGIAASGGYYVAMPADRVVAHPTTVTGSIGVVMTGLNVTGLMEKIGVGDQTLKSGPFKDAGSPFREMREEERAQLQSVIESLHRRFQEVVVAGRPGLDPARLAAVDDGRIFTAEQALELGLIDAIGHFESAVEETERLAGIEESRVVVYHPRGEYRPNIYSRASGPGLPLVDVDLLPLPQGASWLEPGFYYLWAAFTRSP
jgi:protease-4